MIEFLRQTFLFRNLPSSELEKLLCGNLPEERSFKRGELVYPLPEGDMVGFLVEGKIEVRRERADGSIVLLNVLKPKSSFGILSVYSAEDYPTKIYATKNSTLLFFTPEQIKYFVNNSLQISTNLVNFLANRISFLNKKIVTFSGSRVEERLAAYILCLRDFDSSDELSFSCQRAAEEINAGRASVYRAIENLQNLGLVTMSNKKIIINDLKGLERIVK